MNYTFFIKNLSQGKRNHTTVKKARTPTPTSWLRENSPIKSFSMWDLLLTDFVCFVLLNLTCNVNRLSHVNTVGNLAKTSVGVVKSQSDKLKALRLILLAKWY